LQNLFSACFSKNRPKTGFELLRHLELYFENVRTGLDLSFAAANAFASTKKDAHLRAPAAFRFQQAICPGQRSGQVEPCPYGGKVGSCFRPLFRKTSPKQPQENVNCPSRLRALPPDNTGT